MKKTSEKKKSKYLSFLLRHKPEALNLHMDEHGYVSVEELLRNWNTEDCLTIDDLRNIVRNDNKQRYSFKDNEQYIRANQGHSFPVDLSLEPVTPPDILYHGTANRFVDSIRKQGILPMSRQYVHLSKDKDTATNVGSRHGSVKVLGVDTLSMLAKGYSFYLSENGVYLTEKVPPEFILWDIE